ncbi:glycosyltransferase [Gramella sp. GC03-9]|uniref:Glycosyltransferase n=1 Tax=Christiangramia oceanisediminis TaxID=2920386 RepID=A0A9X2KVC7_9FLAO|nr:glycosyltransferase family 2 protein [Gramella oceanisediminis]MCP9198298.1 glycosyltransferase [Gramella oceanisediminis]
MRSGNLHTFSLIVCTYERSDSLERLLRSVEQQSLSPNEIIIVDGSNGSDTKEMLENMKFSNLQYFQVEDKDRGLTRQRNFGITKSGNVDIICFLDDDIVLEKDYFRELIKTYTEKPDAIAVGGWIKDETEWKKIGEDYIPKADDFVIDGYTRKLGQRNNLRKRLGLLSNRPPGYMPEFSHGLAISFLPPSGKSYKAEFFMGGVSSYKKELFEKIKFSTYFEGYSLYEDMDFCLRASRIGQLYVNTAAQVQHFHDASGRPDYFKYGRMMIRNGYYVWKVKYPKTGLKAILKWNLINFLLIGIRIKNAILDHESGAWLEVKGRISEYFYLATRKSKV